MSKTVIYIIRHGESEGNKMNAFLGHTDLDLTETGHAQAENTARYLKDVHIDVIYSSDLKRAYHTAEHTAKAKGMEIVKEQGMREIFAGDWEGKGFAELAVEYPETYGLWVKDVGRARCDGGETVAQLKDRVMATIERLAKENVGKTIAVFTHATPIRIIKNTWENKPIERLTETPWASNASVTRAEYEDGAFKITDYSIDHFQGALLTKLPSNV